MRVLTIALVCVFISACSDDPKESPEPAQDMGADTLRVDAAPDMDWSTTPTFQARAAAGRWFKGDLHVHSTGASNDTGDESTPERIKEVAVGFGLDFVVLTDHSNSTGSDTTTTEEDPALFNLGPEFPYWDRAAELSDDTFLMIDGNEISPVSEGTNSPVGHIGCYPNALASFDTTQVFTDRPRGAVTAADVIAEARQAGCFVTINHPLAPFIWMVYDWSTTDYDALEVYNGTAHWDQSDTYAAYAHMCDLSQRRRVVAVGGSDNHRANVQPPGNLTDIPIGTPGTYVWAENLAWDELTTSLKAGRVTLSDSDVPLELDAHANDGAWVAMVGDELTAQRVWLRARGSTAGAQESRKLQFIEVVPDACNDLRVPTSAVAPEPNVVVVAEFDIEPDTAFDQAVTVDLKPGHAYLVWLRFERDLAVGKRGTGYTNAIYVAD